MSNSPRSPLSWVNESEDSSEETQSPQTPTPPVPGLHIDVGDSGSSNVGAAPTLTGLATAQRSTELSVSLLTSVVEALGRSLDAERERNRFLNDEIRILRAQVEAATNHPPGVGNQDLSSRLDHLEHLHHVYVENLDHDLELVVAEVTILHEAVEGLQLHALAAEGIAMDNPPPIEEVADNTEDAESNISDAMEP